MMRNLLRGFSLIELLITVAIAGILLAIGASGFRIWIANMRIRTVAESIQNGLQLARGEAVRRNALIRFQLMTSVDNGCVLSAANTTITSNWVVSFSDPAGACAATVLNDAFPVTDLVNNPAPQIIQVRPGGESSQNVDVNATQTLILFNGLGRRGENPPVANRFEINVLPKPGVGSCQASGGDTRCLRVTVTVGGQIRLCDPQLSITKPADPQSC